MSPWTALLESLHSAWVDELTERCPEPKPELGMPLRMRAFALPAQGLTGTVVCDVNFGAAAGATSVDSGPALRGYAMLAMDAECAKRLRGDPRKLWAALIKRAGGEFAHRKIKPALGEPQELKGAELPPGFAQVSRVIWIPFKLGQASCYLGVGA